MAIRLDSVIFDVTDPRTTAHFWGSLLHRDVLDDGRGALLQGAGNQVGLRFAKGPGHGTGPNRIHLHLTSDAPYDQSGTVSRVLRLGGSHLDVGQPEDDGGHVVLADPSDNEFCVIEAGNQYLANCGFLGELACDGTRDVGVFWSNALGWPLVWDQDGETATQSPNGGTKVAWGGPPLAPTTGRNRQRFELTGEQLNLEADAERLVALGATRLAALDGGLEMADPDGNEFELRGRLSRP